MSEQQNNQLQVFSLPPQQVTEQALKAYFNMELSRKEYQMVLQNLEKVVPTKENLPECKKIMDEVGKVVKKMNDFATETGNPYFKAHKEVLKAMKGILEPISTKVASINAAIKTKNDELLADLAKAEAEKNRVQNIKNTMTIFINNCTTFITTATTDTQIVNVQKRIGSEKTRTVFYQEFKDELYEKCEALNPLINERKEYIRKEAELAQQAAQALIDGDAEKVAEIKEQQEQLESDMEENVLRLQEEAFQQIVNDVPVLIAEPVGETLSGRNYWRWEVEDLAKLYKKNPELVELQPNKEAIDKILAENRRVWAEEGKTEVVLFGIKFFIKKYL